MKFVALLTEYKSDGLPGQSGPGDVLRLAHALRHPSLVGKEILLVSSLDQALVEGLLPFTHFVKISPTKCVKTGPVSHDHLRARLDEIVKSALDGACVVHAFIGQEIYPWLPQSEMTHSRRSYLRRRIDSSTPNKSFMFHARWAPPERSPTSEQVLAAYVRNMPSSPERNTPNWFLEVVRACAARSGYAVLWCGSTDGVEALDGERCFEYKELSFVQQIQQISAMASCAVGWNSGGLDLAAAAALPILRIGEFQYNMGWGRCYNSYLASATSVGLAPEHEAASDFDREVIVKSLDSFLKNIEMLKQPRHVTLPAGDVLLEDAEELAQQLDNQEIRWTTQ